MYTQVLVYSIAHSLSAQKQYKHKRKPGFIFRFNLFNRIFCLLEGVKITNVRSICRTTAQYISVENVIAKSSIKICKKCLIRFLFGWVVKKYEMR